MMGRGWVKFWKPIHTHLSSTQYHPSSELAIKAPKGLKRAKGSLKRVGEVPEPTHTLAHSTQPHPSSKLPIKAPKGAKKGLKRELKSKLKTSN